MEDTTPEATFEEKEDFTSINPDNLSPELQKIYKSMQADYTRKTQEISKLRKEFTEKESQWQEKLVSYGAAEQEVKQWRDWYQNLSKEEQHQEDQRMAAAEKLPETSYLNEPESADIQKYLQSFQQTTAKETKALKDEILNLRSALKATTDQTSRMFNYQAQLNELRERYPGLNKQELLDYALKTGQPDLEVAYKTLHQDDMIESEVTKRLEERLKTERTKGIRGPGQQVILRSKSGTPRTFEEANEMILQERAAAGLM